jgi:hypothetical protein
VLHLANIASLGKRAQTACMPTRPNVVTWAGRHPARRTPPVLRHIGVALTAPARWVNDRLGRRRCGDFFIDGEDGGDFGGVREPRRPHPPVGAGAIALDLPRD